MPQKRCDSRVNLDKLYMLRRRAVRVRPFVDDGVALPLPHMPPALTEHADSIVIPLTRQQKTVAHLTVDVAFRYSRQADVDTLRIALSKILIAFPVLAGRAVRLQKDDADSELALCVPKLQEPLPAWAYVSFVDDKSSDQKPPCNGIAPDALFDLATECIPSESVGMINSNTTGDPVDESRLGGAPLTRIKVTNYKLGCQIIALSINHTLVDAGSIGLFWTAWSEQYRSCRYSDGACIGTQVTFDHPIFSQASNDTNNEESIPDEWKALLPDEVEGDNPFDESSAAPTSPIEATCTIYYRNAEQIKLLRREWLGMQNEVKDATPPYLSSNDALCGEVCQTLNATSILLCMDWRPVLEKSNFFGYALLFLFLSFANAMDAPVACRRILGWKHHPSADGTSTANKEGVARNKDFVLWKMRNEWRQGKTQLIWNSWVPFFTIVGEDEEKCGADRNTTCSVPRMQMECYPDDIMMSEQMKRMRIAVASKGRLSYAIVLPQPEKGVRIYFFGQPNNGQSLLAP